LPNPTNLRSFLSKLRGTGAMSKPISTLLSSWSRSDSGPALTRGVLNDTNKTVIAKRAAEAPNSLRIGLVLIDRDGTASNLTSLFIRISCRPKACVWLLGPLVNDRGSPDATGAPDGRTHWTTMSTGLFRHFAHRRRDFRITATRHLRQHIR